MSLLIPHHRVVLHVSFPTLQMCLIWSHVTQVVVKTTNKSINFCNGPIDWHGGLIDCPQLSNFIYFSILRRNQSISLGDQSIVPRQLTNFFLLFYKGTNWFLPRIKQFVTATFPKTPYLSSFKSLKNPTQTCPNITKQLILKL